MPTDDDGSPSSTKYGKPEYDPEAAKTYTVSKSRRPYESAAIHAAIREHFVIEHLSFERAVDEYVGLRCVRDGHFLREY